MSCFNIKHSLFSENLKQCKNRANYSLLMRVYGLFFVALPLAMMIYSPFLHSENHHPQLFLDSIKGSANEGEQIVSHFCANCHALKPMIELGAPKIQQVKDWEFRIKKGLDKLFINTSEGLNAMPPRGGCFECTDEQLRLAILVLLPQNVRKPKK